VGHQNGECDQNVDELDEFLNDSNFKSDELDFLNGDLVLDDGSKNGNFLYTVLKF